MSALSFIPEPNPITRILNTAALAITNGVGTMYCALVFTGISLVSLPATLHTGDPVQIVQWVAQTFLQLVLLSVIMVGQNITSARTEKLIQEIHDATISTVSALHSNHTEDLDELRRIIVAVHANVSDNTLQEDLKEQDKV